jgi:hypothetical protein
MTEDHLGMKPRGDLTSVPRGLWAESPLHGSEQQVVAWLRIVDLPRITLGLAEDAVWVRGDGGSVTRFDDAPNLTFLLPVLEVPYSVFVDAIVQGLSNLDLSPRLVDTFPFVGLVKAALERRSAHWSTLVMSWLDAMPLDEPLIVVLDEVLRKTPKYRIPTRAWKSVRLWREKKRQGE